MNGFLNLIKLHKWKFIGVAIALLIVLVQWRVRSKMFADSTWSAPLKKGSVIEAVYGIGTVTANKSFSFKSGVASTVRTLFVREGDPVKKAQSLVDLDGTEIIRAPFDGTVTFLPVKLGETVFPQSNVVTVTDLRDRYLSVNLEQRGAVRVKQGLKARISFDSLRDQKCEGKIESIYSNDSNFLVRIRVEQLPPQILPGMTADVAIAITEKQNVLLVPVATLEGDKVHRKSGSNKTEEVTVKTGIVDGAFAEVLTSDLNEGDVLMIRKKAP